MRGPLLEGQLLPLARHGRGPGLGVVAVELQVPELGVGHQMPVHDQGGTDARAQGEHDDQSVDAPAGAVAGLGQAGAVGVVEGGDRTAQRLGEGLGDVRPDPRLVDVGRQLGHAVLDDRRDDHADGRPRLRGTLAVLQHGDDLADDLADGFRRGRLRRGDAVALPDQIADLQVDDPALDAGAADIDPDEATRARGRARGRGRGSGVIVADSRVLDDVLGGDLLRGLGGGLLGGHVGSLRWAVQAQAAVGSVRTSTPSSVTTMVCSNWAVRRLSAVVIVQSSSHCSHWMDPRVSMGSMVKIMPGTISVA